MENVNGRSFGSETIAIKVDGGDWEVTVRMVERMRNNGEDWQEKVIETKCIDGTFEKAYSVAMAATADKFKEALSLTGNDSLFSAEG